MSKWSSAFTEDEVERADDDGLARAGFAGDDVTAGLEFQREVGHQSKIFDAQRRQHLQKILTTNGADEHGEILPRPLLKSCERPEM